jgi:curli biogenesis system outer membrane secretion channel CsgG
MLTAGQPVHADLEMQLGDVAESVNVTAAASAISTGQQPLRAVGGVLGPTQQVAVLDFANRTSQSQSGQQAADLLSNQLVDSGQVRVIDRDKVQQARQSQDQQSGQTAQQAGERQLSNRDAVALGRALGADAVIVGTVQPAKSNVAVSAQVIDTHRARELAKVVKSDASLKGATDQVGLALQTQLMPPLEGSIIRLDAGSLGITFQPPARPRIGLRLSVYRERRKIGEVTLTSISGQSAIGKFSGSGDPRVGDRVTSVR